MSVEIEEIFGNLEYVASTKGVIRVDGNFMGVSIRLETFITDINLREKTLHLRAEGVNVIPFSLEDRIILRCVLFPKPIHGNVEVVDSQKLRLTIGQLSYVTGTMGKRLRVRVQPKTLLRAKLLMDKGGQLEASIADISAEGMGLILMGANDSPEEMIGPHDQIQVQFHLSGSGDVSGGHILVSACVVYVKALDGGQRKRVGLQLYPDESASKTIRRYIFDRQAEIHNAMGKMDWGLEDHSS